MGSLNIATDETCTLIVWSYIELSCSKEIQMDDYLRF
jgi:hypothetical protein